MIDPWFDLRRYTQARIGQGRVGCATPTVAQLEFQLAHAMARDAVHQPWDVDAFVHALSTRGSETLCLETQVSNRVLYLQRPDLGRRLSANSRRLLQSQADSTPDVALIVTNGLSSNAIDRHGLGLLDGILSSYKQCTFNLGPICLVPNARVALLDEIGAILKARLAVMVVGERPGLSAADSLGIYLTYAPQPGNTDAERNCISNIRQPEGLSYQAAAEKLLYLSQQALTRQLSGVALKDDMPSHSLDSSEPVAISQSS